MKYELSNEDMETLYQIYKDYNALRDSFDLPTHSTIERYRKQFNTLWERLASDMDRMIITGQQ
jgi:hypothetical protein